MAEFADSVIIPHVFGTIALLSMFFIVGTYYNGLFTKLHSEAYQAQLGQVGDYVSSEIIDLVILSRLPEGDQFLVKEIAPPTFIGEKVYNISIIVMEPSYGDADVIRVVTRIDALNIYSVSDLPWSVDGNIQIYTGQDITPPPNVTLTRYLLSDAGIGRSAQIDGCASMIIWCSKAENNVTIGLGVTDRIKGSTP